jgi:hypothetical protein
MYEFVFRDVVWKGLRRGSSVAGKRTFCYSKSNYNRVRETSGCNENEVVFLKRNGGVV